jgi:hypothetical protein
MGVQSLKSLLVMPEEAHLITAKYRTVLDFYNIIPFIDDCDRVYAAMPGPFFVRMMARSGAPGGFRESGRSGSRKKRIT